MSIGERHWKIRVANLKAFYKSGQGGDYKLCVNGMVPVGVEYKAVKEWLPTANNLTQFGQFSYY
jgi:hypothetical protein